MTGSKGRLQPFEHQRSRAAIQTGSLFFKAIEPRVQTADQLTRFGGLSGKLADRANVFEDVFDCLRLERDDLYVRCEHARRALDGFVADGTNFTKLLRQYQIRIQSSQLCFVEIIDRSMTVQL